MTVPQQAITWAACLATLVLLAGLAIRRRLSVCWTFPLYLAVVMVGDLLPLMRPETFFRQWFWVSKELVIALSRFALALELAYRTFRAFPGARATARSALLLLLLLTLLGVVTGTQDLQQIAGETALSPVIHHLLPRLLNGSIWLLTAIAALILWYRVPIHPFHKAILNALVVYLVVFTASLNLIESQGWKVIGRVDYLHTTAYLVLLSYWAFAAWRKSEVPFQAAEPAPALERAVG